MDRLIEKDDIAAIRAISANVQAERVEPYIDEAQLFDVRPVLDVNDGELLQFIVDGSLEQTVDDEITDVLAMLKPAICYFAYARFIENNSVTVTRFGVVKKTDENSTPVDDATIARLARQARNTAQGYMRDVLKYLDDNRTYFTEWNGGQFSGHNQRSGGIRIRGIGGTPPKYSGPDERYC